MRLVRLEAENFRSHEKLSLDLGALSSAVIVGPNGAGKSSLLAAVEFALFGGKGDALLSYGAGRGGVRLALERDGRLVEVARGREREKKSWLVVEVDGEALTQGSIADTQARLESEILGMDREGFRASVYVPQGESGAFAALSPGGRKELLARLLGLDRYEEWRREAAGRARTLAAMAQESQISEESWRARGDELRGRAEDPEGLEREAAAFRSRLAALEEELTEAIGREKAAESVRLRQSLTDRMEAIVAQGKRATAMRARITELKESAGRAPGLREREAQLAELAEAQQAAQAKQAERSQLAARIKGIEGQIREAEGRDVRVAEARTCPTCGQAVDADHEYMVRRAIEDELKGLREERTRLVAELDQIQNAQPVGYDREAHAALRRELRDAEAAGVTLTALGEPENVADLRAQHARLAAERDALPSTIPPGPLPDEIREQQFEAGDGLRAAERAVEAEAVREREMKAAYAEARTHGEDAEAKRVRAAACDMAAEAVSRSGIPAMMIDSAVSAVTDGANEMLAELGASYRVRLSTTRATKKGGVAETLDILIDSGGIEHPLENFSGGEKYRVNIALRTGLAQMMASRAGGRCEFLLVDEPTDLDEPGMNALADVLTRLDRQVILVTHHAELQDRFAQHVKVSRASEASPSNVEVG